MMHTVRPSRRFARPLRSLALSAWCAGGVALVAALLAPAPASAQIGDRQLLATGGGDPYVMILFDTSGSMAWATQCTEDDRTTGYCEGGSEAGEECAVGDSGSACVTGNGECLQLCSHDCEGPSCPRPRNGDDPDSKIYQAKDALYTVMKDITSVRWGFASLNEDELAVGAKHWLYEVTEASGVDTIGLPAVGWQEVFGPQTGGSGDTAFDMTCDRNGAGNVNNAALYETGCYMTSQDAPDTATTDLWSLEKLRRLPKGGLYGNDPVSYFMRNGSGGSDPYLRFTYTVQGAALLYNASPTLTVHVEIDECLSGDVDGAATGCSSWANLGTRVLTYSREVYYDDDGDVATAEVLDPHVGPFLWWEGTTSTDSGYTKDAYFGGRTDGEPELPGIGTYASAIYADKTCRGWEPSNDTWGQRDPVAVPSETDPHSEGGTDYNLRWPTTHNTFPTLPVAYSGYEWIFDYGDVIPLNWDTTELDNDNLEAVLKRLNPKHPTVDDESFAQAPFFADSYASGEFFLRLQTEDDAGTSGEGLDEAIRPLVAAGSTPLAGWFSMFRNWYSGCGDPGNCDGTGWADIAAQYDPNFSCSKKYVLMITDGAETCDGSPTEDAEDYYEDNIEEFPDGFSKTADQCRYRASLSAQEDIETLVIGFGTENKAKLQCANTPVFFANTKGELVTLLIQLLSEIQEQAAAFASAAVPTVQANILDKVYLSSFVPLNDASVWPGRVDAFLKPLPLDADNLPDRSDAKNCGLTGETANCFAWDAGDSQLAWDGEAGYDPERLLLQAPLASEISYLVDGTFVDSSLQIGDGEDERRVFFGLPSTSTSISRRMLLDFPSDPDDVDDAGTENVEPEELTNYEYAWNIAPPDLTDHDARRAAVADVIAFTLKEKRATIDFACTAGSSLLLGRSCDTGADCGESAAGAGDGVCTIDAKIQYLLGDVFHSNPLVLNPPSDFELFTKDLYWPGDGTLSNVAGTGLCGASAATTALRGSQISYAWFSNKNLCRRISLFVGSNDGQLHSFDAGIFDGTNCQLEFANTAGDATLGDTPVCAAPAGKVGDPCNSDANCDTDPDLADGICRRPTVFGDFDYGTGRELFSFIPESMMPVVEELAELGDGDTIGDGELTTQWGPDGTPLSVDVFVDPYVGPGDTPTCEDRVWRTLLLSNYREGGPGLVALDVTQPDIFDIGEVLNTPVPTPGTLDYVPSCATNLEGSPTAGCDLFCRQESGAEDTDCAKLAYPALRWEFRDLDAGAPADTDLNGFADLAETWSRPFIARLSVCDGDCDSDDEPEDRFVAIFGGGISETPANDSTDVTGNWLYMVDVETGEPIYKRGGSGVGTSSEIVGSVPSDITGVDFDTDGRVDTLYFGTTAGFVYKVDLGNGPFNLDDDGLITDGEDALGDPDTGRYDPVQVFSTGGRPIYLEIGAVFVPKKRANALLFGTGNRSNLWENNGVTGRFYTLLDAAWKDTDRDGVRDGGVLTEANYQSVDPDTGSVADYLYDIDGPGVGVEPGWYFTLGANEKLITEAFTLTGITVFTIYDPLIAELDDVCAFSGDSKIFVVNTVTTEGYQIQAGAGARTRYITAPTFTTQPFVEYSATKNPGAANSGTSADDWTEELGDIYRSLKKLFPSGAKFANYTLDIKTVRSDTGVIFIAPVPIAINPHNWKEF